MGIGTRGITPNPVRVGLRFAAALAVVFAGALAMGGAATAVAAPPETTITSASVPNLSSTRSTEITFEFKAEPSEGAVLECSLDGEPYVECESPKTYSSLTGDESQFGTSYTFNVQARNADGPDLTPASHTWRVDTVGPTVTIDAMPANPSTGISPEFSFESGEFARAFECSLEPDGDPDAFFPCSSSKRYPDITTDGSYVFKVRATDFLGNVGSSADYRWTVDTSLIDRSPPIATITSMPESPTTRLGATFTYVSNEPGSTFQCRLGTAPFANCPTTGITYFGFGPGTHTFQVRAIDSWLNEGAPVAYSWEVVGFLRVASSDSGVAMPNTKFTRKPRRKTSDRTPTFRFRSNVRRATFLCKLDRRRYRRCRSPYTTKRLGFGRHVLRVKARFGGKVDRTPARVRFKVVKKGKKHRKARRHSRQYSR